jgi:hypothetical protein
MNELTKDATPSSTKSAVPFKSEPSSSKFVKFSIKPRDIECPLDNRIEGN